MHFGEVCNQLQHYYTAFLSDKKSRSQGPHTLGTGRKILVIRVKYIFLVVLDPLLVSW